MPSATDFLPSSMTEFMNLERTISPNFGSGRISRFSGRRRRAIGLFLFSLQPCPGLRGPHQSSTLMGTRMRPGLTLAWLLGTLGAVLRTALLAVLDALRVEDAAKNVVAD